MTQNPSTNTAGSTAAERYRRRAAEFTRHVAAVPDGRWDDASPCAGWSARDVLSHILDNHRNIPAQVGLTVDLDRPVATDPHGAWAQARDAMQELLEDPSRAGLEYDGYFGRTTLQDTVDLFLGVDLVIHAWDIARATGQDEQLPTDEAEHFYAAFLPLEGGLRMGGVCGPAVEVPDDAPAQDRLLGLFGRTP